MDVTLLIALGAGLTAASLLLGATRALRVPDERVQARVAAVLGTAVETGDRVAVLRSQRRSRFGLPSGLLRRFNTDATQQMLDRAGLPLRPAEYFTLRAMTAGGAGFTVLLGGATFGLGGMTTVLAALAAGVGWFAVPLVVRHRIAKRGERIDTQLVEMCDLMASMLSSGFGYLQALRSTAQQLEEPLSGELRRLLDAVELGGDIDEAFMEMTERLESADLDIVATAVMIQRTSGGNLSEILRGVASTIRDRQAVRLELQTLTARERYSAIVVTLFPFIIVGLLTMLLPDTFGKLLLDPVGRMILGGAIVLDLIGFFVIKRASKVEY